jgi:hypothetical protein
MGELKRIFSRLAAPDPDMSFAEFLKRHRRSVPSASRQLACMIVEGFDAAESVQDQRAGGSRRVERTGRRGRADIPPGARV